MPNVAIVTDSTSDLPPEIRERHGITMVPLNIQFGDETFVDQIEMTTDEFMRRLATSPELPKTSQPAVGLFEQTFRDLAHDHDAIVCVLLSSKLSGTVQAATLAASAVAGVIPVIVFDSLNVSLGCGFQVLRAAELAGQGLGADEIVTRLEAERASYHVIFFVETLEHLRHSGRVSKAASLFGSILQIKPLLRVDEGQVVPFERTRTRKKALDAVVAFGKSFAALDRACAIYNTTPADAEWIAEQLKSVVTEPEVSTVQFSPVLGTHVGPGAIGLAVRERRPGS